MSTGTMVRRRKSPTHFKQRPRANSCISGIAKKQEGMIFRDHRSPVARRSSGKAPKIHIVKVLYIGHREEPDMEMPYRTWFYALAEDGTVYFGEEVPIRDSNEAMVYCELYRRVPKNRFLRFITRMDIWGTRDTVHL